MYEQSLFIIIIIVLIILGIVIVYSIYSNKQVEKFVIVQDDRLVETNKKAILEVESGPIEIKSDVIRDYDYNKIIDPLTEPTRRVPRQDIQPVILKQMIDIPTRGYPDNFTQFGILVRLDGCKDNINNNVGYKGDNHIIRLFGRQEYPGSSRYEYYTMVNSGNDQIKIPVYNKNRKELYCGDIVKICELNGSYRVQLDKFDAPRYYPDILF